MVSPHSKALHHGAVLGLASWCVLLCACGLAGDGPRGPSDRTKYPGGPYGTAEGEVIDNLEFIAPDEKPVALGDIFADPKNRLLLVVTSAGWCTACIEEQPALQALHEENASRGLVVLVALFEDRDFLAADAALAAAWKDQHELSFHVVADPSFQLGDFYDSSLTPMNMFVDLDTMEILRITTGWDPTLVESIVEARLAQ
jgi:thiol-disulfide isomerase/thioredoxin